MKACFDVHYSDRGAAAAALIFEHWTDTAPKSEYVARIPGTADYAPGQFYLRELQPLLAVAEKIGEPIDTYVIDAYCHLSPEKDPGLGVHFHRALGTEARMIGVAKNRFRGSLHAAELLRGESRAPLFVTSIGLDYAAAAGKIASMAGEFRIPTLIKAVDRLCRDAAAGESLP